MFVGMWPSLVGRRVRDAEAASSNLAIPTISFGGRIAVNYVSRIRSDTVDRLFEAVLTLENLEDCYRFFEDLCTIGEIQTLAQRFQAAEMLANGETYDAIARKTGISSATISRIRRFLDYGSDGYQRVLKRLSEPESDIGRIRREETPPAIE